MNIQPGHKNMARKAGTIIFFIYVCFITMNYFYVLLQGTYACDFLSLKPKLSHGELFINFIFTIIPLLVLFHIYRHNNIKTNKHLVKIPIRLFRIFLLFLLPFDILTAFIYGVGKLGAENYQAPFAFKIIIVLANRFDAYFGTYLYTIVAPKRDKLKILLILLLIVLSLVRASLGVFVALLILYILTHYNGDLIRFIKKRFVLIIIGLIFLPMATFQLYELRSQLRGSSSIVKDLSVIELVFGKLIGRLSSYSNSAVIMERKDKITQITRDKFTPFQLPVESLPLPLFSFSESQYGHIIQETGGKYAPLTFLSTGTQGSILIGFYQSPVAFIINIMTLLFFICTIFYLASLLHYHKVSELVFMLLCPIVMGGGGKIFMGLMLYQAAYILLFLFLSFISKYNKQI
jgi:hypothetical protein